MTGVQTCALPISQVHLSETVAAEKKKEGDKEELLEASLRKGIREGILPLRLHSLRLHEIKSIQGKSFRSMAVSSFHKVCSFASYD